MASNDEAVFEARLAQIKQTGIISKTTADALAALAGLPDDARKLAEKRIRRLNDDLLRMLDAETDEKIRKAKTIAKQAAPKEQEKGKIEEVKKEKSLEPQKDEKDKVKGVSGYVVNNNEAPLPTYHTPSPEFETGGTIANKAPDNDKSGQPSAPPKTTDTFAMKTPLASNPSRYSQVTLPKIELKSEPEGQSIVFKAASISQPRIPARATTVGDAGSPESTGYRLTPAIETPSADPLRKAFSSILTPTEKKAAMHRSPSMKPDLTSTGGQNSVAEKKNFFQNTGAAGAAPGNPNAGFFSSPRMDPNRISRWDGSNIIDPQLQDMTNSPVKIGPAASRPAFPTVKSEDIVPSNTATAQRKETPTEGKSKGNRRKPQNIFCGMCSKEHLPHGCEETAVDDKKRAPSSDVGGLFKRGRF